MVAGTTTMLWLLTTTTWTVRLPGTPFLRGLRHIHSPEFFIPAYGLSGPSFRLLETTPPLVTQDGHQLVELSFCSAWGRARARVFTGCCANRSHFLIYGAHATPDILGTLEAEADARGGLILRGGVWPLVSPSSSCSTDDAGVITPYVCARTIEHAVYAGCFAKTQSRDLREYRRRVLR